MTESFKLFLNRLLEKVGGFLFRISARNYLFADKLKNKSMKNKTKIKITKVKNRYWYLESMFTTRYAKVVGDEEVVNNTVLGFLKRKKEIGDIDFEIIS